jgi:PAS domain S-box-containing protein
VERSARRAAGVFALVGAVWVVATDVVLLEVFHRGWTNTWPRTLNRALFVAAATVVVYVIVRHHRRQEEDADVAVRRSREALQRSEARYRSLVERVPGVVWLNEVDRDDRNVTRCVYIGPQIEDLLGRTPEEWIADEDLWERVIHPADHARILEVNDRADETGTLSVEYRAIHTDGSVVWIHDEAVLIPAEDDQPAYWQGVMVDITAQRVQDEALHELTESLRGVFLASPLAIMVLEPDGRVRHWNPAAERMFGWSAREIIGRQAPYVPPDKVEEFAETRRRTIAGETLAGFETSRMRKDGSLVEVSLSTAALTSPEGTVTGLLGVIEDITERRRAAVALRTAEEQHRSLVEDGPAIVYLHDAHEAPARLTYISPQIVELLGYPHEAWTEDPLFWVGVVHPDDRERVLREDARAIEDELPLDIEYRMVAKGGAEAWVHDRVMVVRDPEGAAMFRQGVRLDVTDRRRAEDEYRAALDRQLRLANRLELLHQVDLDVLASRSIDEMAGRTLDHLRLLVPYDRGSVTAIDPATGRFTYLAVRAGPGLTLEPDLESLVPDAAAREILSRDLVVADLEELHHRSPYFEGARAIGIRSALLVALHTDDGQGGVLALTSRTLGAFDEEALDIAKEVGSELAIAIAQMRLREALGARAEELERLAEERRQMLHRIVRAQEEERERVALELHDGLGQLLTSISLFASDLEDEVGEEARARASRVNELIGRAIADSRALVWSLRPPELDRLGLVPALRRLASETSVQDTTVDLHEEIGDIRLGPESEAVVYRVVQEAVHNAQKHAHASAISILLQRHDGQLTTLVEDDGCGFDPSGISPGRGLGLIGMRERAELVEGDLVVESARDAGTRVRLMVPIATPGGSREGSG